MNKEEKNISNTELKDLRKQIDFIDTKIIKLLDRRMELTYKVGKVKSILGIPPNAPHREDEIIAHIDKNITSNAGNFIKNIYKKIFKESLKHQESKLG